LGVLGDTRERYTGARWTMASCLNGLLADIDSLYVHLDPGMSHLVKLLLDEVFRQFSEPHQLATNECAFRFQTLE
jgi:hypothetical protein